MAGWSKSQSGQWAGKVELSQLRAGLLPLLTSLWSPAFFSLPAFLSPAAAGLSAQPKLPLPWEHKRDMASPTSSNPAHAHFESFLQAQQCRDVLTSFQGLCEALGLQPGGGLSQYHKIKAQLNYWSAKSLWAKLDKRASHSVYQQGRACLNIKVDMWSGAGGTKGRGGEEGGGHATPAFCLCVFAVPGGGCWTLRAASSCGAGHAGGTCGAGGKAHQVLASQCAPPLALHHP